jgi:outer membrane receptor for ferrienterochelin and colicins
MNSSPLLVSASLLAILLFVSPSPVFAFPAPSTATAVSPAQAPATSPAQRGFLADVEDFGDLDLASLLDVEVQTGGGFKRRLSEVPAVVEVFSREDIVRFGVRDLNELMFRLTGVYSHPANLETIVAPPVSIRGGGVSDKILIIVDDHPLLDEFEKYAAYAIPIDSIERVEFLRGPAAVLYGSSAMAGVVRIVTRRGDRTGGSGTVLVSPWKQGGEVSAAGTYGRDDPEDWSIRLDLQTRQSELIPIEIAEDSVGASGTYPRQVTYISTLATVRRGGWYFRQQNHLIQTRIIGLQARFDFETGPSTLQYHGGELGYSRRQGRWSWALSSALDYRERRIDIGYLPPFAFAGREGEELRTVISFDGIVLTNNASVGYEAEQWNLLAGARYRYLRSLDFGFHLADGTPHPLTASDDVIAYVHDVNLFGQGSYSPFQSITLLTGVRFSYYDRGTENFIELTPEQQDPEALFIPMGRAGIVWKPVDVFSAKALYGRSFRLPSMFESYPLIRGIISVATDLEPEVQDTFELAADLKPDPTVFLRANTFFNQIADAIEFSDRGVGDAWRYRNQDLRYYTYGVESTLQWLPTKWVQLFGSATFSRGYWEDDRPLDGMPSLIAKGGATFWAFDRRLLLTPFGWYTGPRYESRGSTTWHLATRWQVRDWIAVLGSADNVFNREVYSPYYDGLGNPAIAGQIREGRVVRVGLSADF